MISRRNLFFDHIAQTSRNPVLLEIERAQGSWLFDVDGKKYLDLVSGISVSNIGHGNREVLDAIRAQAEKYLHVMVYGEFVEAPQVQYAQWLADHLPENLSHVYFTNSGSEAVEGALKLAKRYTGRNEIISFQHSYHGSTQGALSAGNSEERKMPFRPLIPANRILTYNDTGQLALITEHTAAVLVEPVQAEAGVILPAPGFLQKLRALCNASGALLIFDENQTGFGRTGKMFALYTLECIPDILVLGKALGGGMPLGAFISAGPVMESFLDNPTLGHLTTFGGHPVCCAAGLASARVLERSVNEESTMQKAKQIRDMLQDLGDLRNCGLLFALGLGSSERVISVCHALLARGVLCDWFLYAPDYLRIAPPLTIDKEDLQFACSLIREAAGNN